MDMQNSLQEKNEIDWWKESIKKFQEALREEKLSLLKIPTIKKSLVDRIIQLHEPSKQKRISAKEVILLVSLIRSKKEDNVGKVLLALDKLHLNILWWNSLREEAEKKEGKELTAWKKKRAILAKLSEPLIVKGVELIKRVVKTNNPNIKEAVLSDGIIGFYKALEKYNPSLSTPFPPYAQYWIKNEVATEALRSKTVQISSYQKKKNSRQSQDFSSSGDDAIQNPTVVSLDSSINSDGDPLHEVIPAQKGFFLPSDAEELKKEWIQIIEKAPRDFKAVLMLKYPYPVWEVKIDRYFLGAEAFQCRKSLSLRRILIGINKGGQKASDPPGQ